MRKDLTQAWHHDQGKVLIWTQRLRSAHSVKCWIQPHRLLQFAHRPFPAFLLAPSPSSWCGFWSLAKGMLRRARVSILYKHWEADTGNAEGSAPLLTTTLCMLQTNGILHVFQKKDAILWWLGCQQGFPWAESTGTDPLTFNSPVTWDWAAGTTCSTLEDKK